MSQACWTGVLARALLVALVLWDPCNANVDSDEEVESEWTLWKQKNGVAYDEEVSLHTVLQNPTLL